MEWGKDTAYNHGILGVEYLQRIELRDETAKQIILDAVRYHMAPFSVDPRRSPAPSRRDTEISKVMIDAIEPALFLERYPRSVIDVFVELLAAQD